MVKVKHTHATINNGAKHYMCVTGAHIGRAFAATCKRRAIATDASSARAFLANTKPASTTLL